jgi:hypothetical protein
MTKNELLEPEKLLAYRAGELDDPVAFEHIRSSEACKKWISEHRLIRLLAKSGEGQEEPSDISQETISKFVAEGLPPDEMLEIEDALTKNTNLFEDYLAIRTEQIAEHGPAPSKELDDRVLNLLLANVAETPRPADPVRSPLSDRGSKIQNYLTSLFAPGHLAWAGGIAAAFLIAVVGGKQIGLYGVPQVRPLIVASLESDDVSLKFRGGPTVKKAATVSEGMLTSIVLQFDPKVADALLNFEKTSSKQMLGALVTALNDSVAQIEPEVFTELTKGARFDLEKIDGIQIHPSLWKQIQSDSSKNPKIVVSVIEAADPEAPPNLRKSESPPTLNILYFALIK